MELFYRSRSGLGATRCAPTVAFVCRSVCGFSVARAYGLHRSGHGFGVRDCVDCGGIWALFLVNTIVFWRRKHWAKYRKRTLVYLVVLPFVVGLLRPVIFELVFGAEDRVFVQVEEEEFVLAELRLYENGRFYAQAYGTWMVENTGRYEWAEKELVLEYDDAPSPHMDRLYTLEGERLMPKDSTRQVLVVAFSK